uniref:FBD domain-containing protein n=1 Tax=Panagrolaimus davidi TaxID=227884 RepID=A0A914QSA1_9BILA
MYSTFGSNNLIWQSADEVPNNLWITGTIFSDQVSMFFTSSFFFDHVLNESSFMSKIIPKIVVCDVKKLELHGQDLSLKEYEFLTASGMIEDFIFPSTLIKEENGKNVYMETILECLPNVKSVLLSVQIPSFSSVAKAEKICLQKLEKFVLRSVPHDFNFEAMLVFMTKHKYADIRLNVSQGTSNFPYMSNLQKYVDQVVQEGSIQHPPPLISFPGQSEESKTGLMKLYSHFHD